MEFLKNEELKKKYIAGAVVALIAVGSMAYLFGGKSEPKQPEGVSGSQGATLSKAVEEPKNLDSYLNGANPQQNNIVGVDSKKFISIDNVAITSEQADKMMMTAVQSSDVERVKYLLQSGVKIDFTDDSVCTRDTLNYLKSSGSTLQDNDDNLQFQDRDYINQTGKIKEDFFYIHPFSTFTTNCSKLSLQAVYKKLDRRYSDEEFDIFFKQKIANEWKDTRSKDSFENFYNEKRKEMQQSYKENREIFDLLLNATPKKDYYQFVTIIENSNIPVDVRLKLVKLYTENIANLPVSEGRQKFVKAYEDTALSMLKQSPDDEKSLKFAFAYKNPLYTVLVRKTELLHSLLADGVNQVARFNENVDSEIKRGNGSKIGTIVSPKLTVDSLSKVNIPYSIQGMTEQGAVWTMPTNYTGSGNDVSRDNFLQLYYANTEFKVIKSIIDLGKININQQDYKGRTFLHRLVDFDLDWYGASKGVGSDRATAVLVRYFLNSGANPTLMNKKGNTPHGMIQEANYEYTRAHPGTTEFIHKETLNAFTLKDYN